jgi:hypothetical protein
LEREVILQEREQKLQEVMERYELLKRNRMLAQRLEANAKAKEEVVRLFDL